MNGLELNKIAAAVLLSGLIAMISGTAAQVLYHGSMEAEEGEMKRGYQVEAAAESTGIGAPAAEAAPVDIAGYMGAGDAAAGEKVTAKCTSCHSFEKGGADKVGPNLYGILGSSHAHKEGFAYSDAMLKHKGEKWDYQNLSEFVAHPAKTIPGTKMGFAGIKKPEERANLLAYLRTLSDAPMALPAAPKPGAAPNGAKGDDAKAGAGAGAATGAAQGSTDKPGTGNASATPATPGVKTPDAKAGTEGSAKPAAPVGASGKAENADTKKGADNTQGQKPASGTTAGKSDVPVEAGHTAEDAGNRAPGQGGK